MRRKSGVFSHASELAMLPSTSNTLPVEKVLEARRTLRELRRFVFGSGSRLLLFLDAWLHLPVLLKAPLLTPWSYMLGKAGNQKQWLRWLHPSCIPIVLCTVSSQLSASWNLSWSGLSRMVSSSNDGSFNGSGAVQVFPFKRLRFCFISCAKRAESSGNDDCVFGEASRQ